MKGDFDGDFMNPHNIEVDENNRVYVADRENHRIQVFDTEGNFITKWTNTGRVFGLTLAPHNQILATEGSADQMRLLIMDRNSGKIIQSIGSKGSLQGQFDLPHSVVMASNGDIYVGETTNKRVQKFVLK
ncbi:hypothetical protein EYV94_23565 [Puteibacter caeruleilacunae]|nr:hypothetical protein EYV94_23565 [Puteibacter caeruleilacunae]